MTETQERLLGLLKEIDTICREEGIDYYLAGGSLVGAVRHGGFLPWDDDADIHMSVENAIRFQSAVEKRYRETGLRRTVFSSLTDGNCMNSHWRYFNLDTTLLMRGLVGSDSPQGQFVDIFVLYPLPTDEESRNRCLDDFEVYVELKAQNTVLDSLRDDDYLKRYREAKAREKQIGKPAVLKEFEDRMYHFSQNEAKEWFIVSPFPSQRATPKAWWGTPRYIPFEDTTLPVAEKAEMLLSFSFGPSWFEVPAHEERGEHVFVSDYEVPYTVYTGEYNKHLNVKDFYDFEVAKKEYWFELMPTRNFLNPHIRKLQGIRTALELQEFIEQKEIDLNAWMRDGRKEELGNLFSPYFELLQREEFRYWGIYIDMPDEYLYAALFYLFFDGNYTRGRKVLNGRRELERPLSDGLQRLADLSDAIDELLTAIYGELDYEKAKDICKLWLEKEPMAVHFMRASILLQKDYEENVDAKKLLSECDRYLELYLSDGELLKYKGDLLHMKGDAAEGDAYYRKALDTLRNGYCITQIKQALSIE